MVSEIDKKNFISILSFFHILSIYLYIQIVYA
jgi:hypothetical protein